MLCHESRDIRRNFLKNPYHIHPAMSGMMYSALLDQNRSGEHRGLLKAGSFIKGEHQVEIL